MKTKTRLTIFTQEPNKNSQKPSRQSRRDGIEPTGTQNPSRARETPKPVAALIELLNLLPLDHRRCEQLPKLKFFKKNSNSEISTDRVIDALIADWPERLKRFVTATNGNEFHMRGLPFHLNFYIAMGLDGDESHYRYLKEQRFVFVIESYNLLKRLPSLKESGGFFLTPVTERVSCDENYCLVFSKSEISERLEGVEANRIRQCPICFNFFWANHLNKTTCSNSCSNAMRNRVYRETNKDEIKRRRIERENNKEQSALAAYSTTNKGKE